MITSTGVKLFNALVVGLAMLAFADLHTADRATSGSAVPARAGFAGSFAGQRAAPAPAAPALAGAVPQLWTAVAASGKVEARAAGIPVREWRAVRRGDSVEPRSHIKTHRRSRTTLTRQGDLILVAPRSEVILPGYDARAQTRLRQGSGKALYQVEPGRKDRVEVLTPYLVAGVKGTVFSVIVDDEFVSVSVVEGNVEVRSLFTGERADLFAGDMAVLEGPDKALEVYRDDLGEAAPSRTRPSEHAKRSLKETDRLIRAAARDNLRWEDLDGALWRDFTGDDWLRRGDTRRERIDPLDGVNREDEESTGDEDRRKGNTIDVKNP